MRKGGVARTFKILINAPQIQRQGGKMVSYEQCTYSICKGIMYNIHTQATTTSAYRKPPMTKKRAGVF